jgi:hypothetical protein
MKDNSSKNGKQGTLKKTAIRKRISDHPSPNQRKTHVSKDSRLPGQSSGFK